MTPDTDPTLERAYPYHSGWRVMACGALLFGVLGGVGAAMFPFGCEQHQAGRLPLAVALWVIGAFGIPMLFFSVFAIYAAIRDSIAPPIVRVTPNSLVLPGILRQHTCEQEEQDERSDPKVPDPPEAHPEVIPFAAIRWMRREIVRPTINHQLMIGHDLSLQTLVIEQAMMNREDFDELEAVLRSALPGASAGAPPSA